MDNPVNPESPTERLKALLFRRLRRHDERRFAARVCDEALAALAAVRAAHPQLRDAALYEAVIARRLKLDAAGAHSLLRRVRESLDDWESAREPRFIDVVKYMIVSEYLAQEQDATGMVLDLNPFLAERLDPEA